MIRSGPILDRMISIQLDNMTFLYIDKSTYKLGQVIGIPILILGTLINCLFLWKIIKEKFVQKPIYLVLLVLTITNLIAIVDFAVYQNFLMDFEKSDKGAYCFFNLIWNFMFRYISYSIQAANACSRFKLLCADQVLSACAKKRIVTQPLFLAMVFSFAMGLMNAYMLVDFDGSQPTFFKFGRIYLFCRKKIEVHLFNLDNFFDDPISDIEDKWKIIYVQVCSLFGPHVFICMIQITALYKFYSYRRNYIANMTRLISKNERKRHLAQNEASFKGLITLFLVNIVADLYGITAAELKPSNIVDNSTFCFLPMHLINWVIAPMLFYHNFLKRITPKTIIKKIRKNKIHSHEVILGENNKKISPEKSWNALQLDEM